MKKIMIVTHEWEGRRAGGAQRSANALALGLSREKDCEVLLASAVPSENEVVTQPKSKDHSEFRESFVVSQTDGDYFSWSSPKMASGWQDLLMQFNPDIVHLHHYYQVGIDLPLLIRQTIPSAIIVLTLHEYLAICLNSGQMVDFEGRLCLSSNPEKCARCTGLPIERTFLRDAYIRKSLELIDCFVAPSDFARHRYLMWGIEESKIVTTPNPVELQTISQKVRHSNPNTLHIVYIGQHTPFKGLEILFEGLQIVKKHHPGLVSATVYGDDAEIHGADFTERIERAFGKLTDICARGGTYKQSELASILDNADAVVVPSTWWENSPVVIEEALSRRIPVICSDIGGMAEKVRDGIDGYHFPAGSAAALAELLIRLARNPEQLELPNMRLPSSIEEIASQHLGIYHNLGLS